MTVADIGPNSNRRQVACAVSDLQDDANLVGSGDLADRIELLETSVGSVDVTARDADLATAELAIADLETSVGVVDVTARDADLATAEATLADLAVNGAIVAGPTTLEGQLYLTAQLLRKTLTVAAGPNSTTVNVAHGITTPTKILGVQIQLTNGTNHLAFSQGGMLADTNAHSILVAIDGTNVSLTSGAGGDYSLYGGSIVLVYVD
jgi:hypothetical protein